MVRRTSAGLLLGLGLLLATVAGAVAKSDIVARLDAPLPIGAHAGQDVTIGWTLSTPLIGTAVVLRVYPSTGGVPSDWYAQEDRAGHWVASGTVPPGGIATIGIGIPGESCIASGCTTRCGGCTPAVDFFTITDPSGAPIPPRPADGVPDTATHPLASPTRSGSGDVVLIALLLGAVPLAAVGWRMRRR